MAQAKTFLIFAKHFVRIHYGCFERGNSQRRIRLKDAESIWTAPLFYNQTCFVIITRMLSKLVESSSFLLP